MSNNCLVSKLKGSVAVPSLLKIGEILVHVKVTTAANTREVTWVSGKVGSVRVLDGSNKICLAADSDYTNSITIAAGSTGRTIKFAAGEYDIVIGNYYNIFTFNLFSDSAILFTIDISDTIQYIEHIKDISLFKSNIYGLNINEIHPDVSIFNSLLLNYTNAVGVYEEFIENIVAGGRKSGKTNIELRDTSVTFNGSQIRTLGRTSFVAYYSDTGATIRDSISGSSSGNLLATYTKSSGTWTYKI